MFNLNQEADKHFWHLPLSVEIWLDIFDVRKMQNFICTKK